MAANVVHISKDTDIKASPSAVQDKHFFHAFVAEHFVDTIFDDFTKCGRTIDNYKTRY